jgi:hypothetical protein
MEIVRVVLAKIVLALLVIVTKCPFVCSRKALIIFDCIQRDILELNSLN